MNLDFSSSNYTLIRQLESDRKVIAEGHEGPVMLRLVPAIQGEITITNSGKGTLTVSRCAKSVETAPEQTKMFNANSNKLDALVV